MHLGWEREEMVQGRLSLTAQSHSCCLAPSPTFPRLLALVPHWEVEKVLERVEDDGDDDDDDDERKRVSKIDSGWQTPNRKLITYEHNGTFLFPSTILRRLLTLCHKFLPGGSWAVIISHINIFIKGFFFYQSMHALCSRRVNLSQ